MDISNAITLNIIAILCLGAFAALLVADLGERLMGFFGGIALGFWLSFWGWAIYVAVHFLQKYW